MGFPNNFMFRSGGSGGGTGGSAGINYVPLIFAGDSLTGINTYNDGASATPTDGTGGVVTGLTTSLNTTTPLVGTSSLRFSKDAANRQGMGWSYDFTIDRLSYDASQPLFIQAYYRTSANFASSDMRVFLYDRTNSVLYNVNDIANGNGNIIAAPADNQLSCVGFSVTGATSWRLIWHIASVNATAYDVDLDNITVSPQTTQPGAIVTEWVSYTPTGTWSTNTTYTGQWRRVGDSLEFKIRLALTGAPTAAGLFINFLPNSLTVDTTKLNGSTQPKNISFGVTRSAGNDSAAGGVYLNTTQLAVVAFNSSGTYLGEATSISNTIPATYANGDSVDLHGSVPITGWAASAALSTTDTLFTSAVARLSGDPASATAGNPIIFPTRDFDNLSAYNTTTGLYTIPKSGYYRIHGFIASAATAGTTIQAYVNSNFSANLGACDSNGEVTYTGIVFANQGNTISVRPSATVDAGSASILNIEEIPNFQIFSVYGQTEYQSATSGIKTPSATSQYQSLTSNSLTLTPGTWRLFGSGSFNNGGVSPSYTYYGVGIFGGNGADSASTPTALSTLGTILSASPLANLQTVTATGGQDVINSPTYIFRNTSTVTVYVVTFCQFSGTASNGRIIGYLNAERLQ